MCRCKLHLFIGETTFAFGETACKCLQMFANFASAAVIGWLRYFMHIWVSFWLFFWICLSTCSYHVISNMSFETDKLQSTENICDTSASVFVV